MSEDAKLSDFANREGGESTKNEGIIRPTSWGKIPSEWDEKTISEVTELVTDGSHNPPKRVEDGIQLLSGQNIQNGYIDFNKEPSYISPSDFEQMDNNHSIQKGDLLLTIVGSIGRSAVVDGKTDFALQRSIALLRTNDEVTTPFLKFVTDSERFHRQADSRSRATAQGGLYLEALNKINLPVPSLPEQRKIATVLYTVDRAIEKTEEIIDRNQTLKNGIRQDIFQHGGLSGENTVSQRIGPKEYEMPEDWDVVSLSQVAEINGGQGFKSSNYVDEGVPLIKISNVQNGYLDLQDTSYLPEEYLDEYNEVALSKGDVVLVLTRPIIGDGIKAARINRDDRFLLNQRLAVVDPLDEDTILREYLYHLIFTNVFIDQVKATVRATHQPNLSKTDLQNFSIPIPEIEQQRNICRVLRSVEDTVEKNKSYRAHLKRIKRGLMQDLLSGKVRTTDTNMQVPDKITQHG